jgi:hypothetical protein
MRWAIKRIGAALICVFVIGVVQWVEPLGLGIVDAAKACTAPNAVLVDIDHKSAKTDCSTLIGIRASWEATSIDHSADCKRANRNGRATFVENMRSWDNGPAPNWIGAFGGLQGTQHSVANVLDLFVTFDNLRVATADIRDHESQFDVSLNRRWKAMDFANNQPWTVSGDKIFIGDVNCATSQLSLLSRDNRQGDSQNSDPNCSERSYRPTVGLQEINYSPQNGAQTIKHRGIWFPVLWLFGMLLAPVAAIIIVRR